MEIELLEIREFLAGRAPFDALAGDTLDELPGRMQVRYLRRGSDFPPPDSNGSFLYVVRSGAVELCNASGTLCEKLAEGDLYVEACQLVDLSGCERGTTIEDTLFYLIDCATVLEMRSDSDSFDRHFSNSIRERLKHAVNRLKKDGPASPLQTGFRTTEIRHLINRSPAMLSADESIQTVARAMAEANSSSALLTEQGGVVGVITDWDLRKRCVAAGLDVREPARAIMTASPATIESSALTIEAQVRMAKLQVHHLAVCEGEQIIGMLSASDLAREQSASSAYLALDVMQAGSVDELARLSARLPALQAQLSLSGASALHVGEAVSRVTDAITRRLIEMAEDELGSAPVPYAWLAGGSQARLEQTSHSDQDNALVIADAYRPEHAAWFEGLARRVNDGLHACGFIYCPGNAMASNPQWRQPLRVWRGYFDTWIERPEPKALMLASIFFDLRRVAGDRDLLKELQARILSKTVKNRIFIAYLAANALKHRPPLGFFRQFVLIHDGEHDDTFDIKHRGIVPITEVARVFSLSEGLAQTNTTRRLCAAGDTRALSGEMADNLVDALEFIASLRIRHQARQIMAGAEADNFQPPDELSGLERDHLKDAFKVIQSIQDTLEQRYQAGRFA